MKWRILSGLFLTLVVGGPLLYINFVALGRQAQFETATTGETVIPEPIAKVGLGADRLFGNFREGREIDALFDTQEMTRKRIMQVERVVALEDVLQPGEEVPEGEFHKLYLEARAPLFSMEEECPLMLATFAKSCVAANSEIRRRKDGTYRLVASLAYLPSYDVGTLPTEGPVDLYRVSVGLSRDRLMRLVPRDRLQEIKSLLYQDAMTACEKLREERGNCAIRRVEFTSFDSPDDPQMVQIAAAAFLAWVGPRAAGVDNSMLGNVMAADPEDAAERASLFARVTGMLAGTDEEPNTSATGANKPSVLRGGNALRGASEGRFIAAPD